MPYYPPDGGGGGGGSGTYVSSETPSGPIDGANKVFILSHTPVSNSVRLFLNGLRQKQILDFSISSATITFVTAPNSGDLVIADYNY